jgi:hypothetical protein
VTVVETVAGMRAAVNDTNQRVQRFAAWFVTGPLGHLVSGVADWVALLWTLAQSRRQGSARNGVAEPGRSASSSSPR